VGRRKTYNREEILDRAMDFFWVHGYHATSTRELSKVMGVNACSMYAEFGSKEALYEAAVERYEQLVVHRHFGALESEGASLEEIRDVLQFFGGSADVDGSFRGCLLCNGATELAPTVQGSRDSTARYIDRLAAAFTHALRNAEAERRLVEAAPIEALARFFAVMLMGLFVLMRTQADGAVLRDAANQTITRLDQVTLA